MNHDSFAKLPTEQRHPGTADLDRLSPLALLTRIQREDQRVIRAVKKALPRLVQAVDLFVGAWKKGGTIYLVGAGTSGRLAVLEAAECPPTFHTAPERIQAIMAGGPSAVFAAKEGSEDSETDARLALRSVRPHDLVIGIAASGVTPFVGAALRTAQSRKAKTVFLTCNTTLRVAPGRALLVALDTGPEVLTGSTRLKAGSACKMALNLMTTASFVRLGKTYGNRMVDLQPKSRKLVSRSTRLVQELGRVNPSTASKLLKQSGGRAKVAIVMARRGVSAKGAEQLLSKANGFLRRVLDGSKA